MPKRKLPVGIQSFEDLRNNNYIYVDKTEYIWNLVESGKVYFLSRPRRFGKSLLVSTLEAYFLGKKDLFKGLAIEELENSRGEDAWAEYPVISFYLSGGEYNSADGLADRLAVGIESCIERYELNGQYEVTGETLAVRFLNLIKRIYEKTGKQVVILVDEYDKPLLETMVVNPEQEEKNRQLYKGFFGVLKDMDPYLKFVFFTGVTKFSKVSIFSDLNQLKDISLRDEFSGICGITEEELTTDFGPEIRNMAEEQELSEEECVEELRKMYDGYHFSKRAAGVYNPFSLLNAFDSREFGSYWFESGTPTFLVRKLEASNYTIQDFDEGVYASRRTLSDYREDNPDPVPLFYQAGYLTISGWNKNARIYALKLPNREVREGLLEALLPDVFHTSESESDTFILHFTDDLEKGDVDAFMNRMQALFARIPYVEMQQKTYEPEWRNAVFILLELLGQVPESEKHIATGRVDCIVETTGYVYVMEFKLDKTADEALAQIDKKGYADPYKADRRTVLKVGVNFSTEKRNIEEWKVVPV